MSEAVDLSELADIVARFRLAYLLTVGDDGRVHAAAIQPRLAGERIEIPALGRRSRHNAAARSTVTLLWPPVDGAGYSLIVDGEAQPADDILCVSPAGAVLHQSAPGARPERPCAAQRGEPSAADDR